MTEITEERSLQPPVRKRHIQRVPVIILHLVQGHVFTDLLPILAVSHDPLASAMHEILLQKHVGNSFSSLSSLQPRQHILSASMRVHVHVAWQRLRRLQRRHKPTLQDTNVGIHPTDLAIFVLQDAPSQLVDIIPTPELLPRAGKNRSTAILSAVAHLIKRKPRVTHHETHVIPPR